MKLRIKGSSLRLRLTQAEVAQLAAIGEVAEQVQFADATLTYRLRRDATAETISAVFRGNVIDVRVPDGLAREWARNNEVTLAHSQAVPGADLRIAIEKDFACLAPREGEDESDHYPHPEAGSGKTC